MATYRALFFNHAGKVFSEMPFDASDDSAAVDYARRVFDGSNGLGYEIRQDKFLVHREIFRNAALA